MSQKIDLGGMRIGRLLVTQWIDGKWECRCDCGTEKRISTSHLRSGRVNSCGCLHQELRHELTKTHGMKHTPIYTVWINMRQRCENPTRKDWANYGGRGIMVCKEWGDFSQFLSDMGEPMKGQFIDRINVDGNYEKSNCQWVSRQDQNRNKRNSILVTVSGVTKPMIEWCDELGMNYFTAHSRIRRGATPLEAIGHA